MTRLLDVRTSQNASENNIAIPVERNTQTLFAQVGLDATGAVGVIRTTMAGMIALKITRPNTTVTITVVRGTTASSPVVLKLATTVSENDECPLILTFAGADFDVPFSPEIVYSVFLLVDRKGVTRTGPESFYAQLYSD
ncbi:hypothetical protein [Paenibacillus marinisediminis]